LRKKYSTSASLSASLSPSAARRTGSEGRAACSGVTFRTEPVTRGELLATVGGTGTLEPEEVIDVGTQVGGLIKEFGSGTDGKPVDALRYE
jgi:multidrug efflux pump subunit AcrA (membrane-fusion protein)